MDVGEVVTEVGLWWPAADEDGVREAARAWARAASALDHAGDVGRAGAARASARWTGDAARRFAGAWQQHEQALHDDAAGARAVSDALTHYAEAVADAKRRVTELAVTAGATLVAGVGLAWLTFGASAAAAAGVSAGLVAAASGTDEQGRAFAARYDPLAGDGLAAMDREARGTRSLGDALRATAHDYAAGDATAAGGLEPP